MLDLRRAIPAVVREGQDAFYHPRLGRIRGASASGVYAIIDARSGIVMYVGESHTGRLYDTLTRHFRAWRPKAFDSGGGRRGGTTYDRERVLVVWETMAASRAVDAQFDEIERLDPRDNAIVPAADDLPI